MSKIKQIKLAGGDTYYDIAAKYDINNNEIINTYATKQELSKIKSFEYKIYDSLPEPSAQTMYQIALISDGKGAYKEYLTIKKDLPDVVEAWALNDSLTTSTTTYLISFMSNETDFTGIILRHSDTSDTMNYISSSSSAPMVYNNGTWADNSYKKIFFKATTSGNLNTWLQANGTQQSSPFAYYKWEQIGTTEVDLSGYEKTTNKVTTISSSSTDTQYPSAKAVYTTFTPVSSISMPPTGKAASDLAVYSYVNTRIGTVKACMYNTYGVLQPFINNLNSAS